MTYIAAINGGHGGETTFRARSHAAAVRHATRWARDGSWPERGPTFWVGLHLEWGASGESRHRVAIDPPAPDCTRRRHRWVEARIQTHGGGVIFTEVCKHCGCRLATDTWAQDPETGTQGLRSIEYRAAEVPA